MKSYIFKVGRVEAFCANDIETLFGTQNKVGGYYSRAVPNYLPFLRFLASFMACSKLNASLN